MFAFVDCCLLEAIFLLDISVALQLSERFFMDQKKFDWGEFFVQVERMFRICSFYRDSIFLEMFCWKVILLMSFAIHEIFGKFQTILLGKMLDVLVE